MKKTSLQHQVYRIILLVLFLTGSGVVKGQINEQKPPEETRILFLLDASGSMFAEMDNGVMRMNVAKNILGDLVDSLRVDDNLQLALRVYGHQHHRRYGRCDDTKLEIPFGKNNHDRILNRLPQIQPKGTTPIAHSLEEAAGDFPQKDDVRNIVILITDGLESCDGDPCEVSLRLQEKNIFLKPFVVGLGMDEQYEEEFGCLGKFYDAQNVSEFKSVLDQALKQSLEPATVSVELLDHRDRPRETDVNVTFVNNFTKIPKYEFVHYRDSNGNPDSVTIDPVLNYDVVVNTIPPVVKKDLEFEAGTHNVVRVNSPQGKLSLNQNGHTEYENGVKVLVRKASSDQVINIQNMGTSLKYLQGTYDLEILTLPRTYYNNVEVKPHETTEVNVPGPGVINLKTSSEGIGSIYKMNDDGTQEWIKNLPQNQTLITFAIQPGNYKWVFRPGDTFGSKYTQIKTFKVQPGATINF